MPSIWTFLYPLQWTYPLILYIIFCLCGVHMWILNEDFKMLVQVKFTLIVSYMVYTTTEFNSWFVYAPYKNEKFLACNQLLHCDRTCAYIVQVRKLITRLRETIKTNFQLCSRRMQPTDSQTIIVLGPNDRYSGSQPVAGKAVNNTLYGEDITHKTYLHCM